MDRTKPIPKDNPFATYRPPNDGLPWFLNLCITTRCVLNCPICQSNEGDKEIADPKRILSFLDRVSRWLTPPRIVTLTGGEPLTHPAVVDYVTRLAFLGYLPGINTNGVLLDEPLMKSLVEAGLALINFSIDGLGQAHDHMRNTDGLFEKIMDAVSYLGTTSRVQINVSSVITAQNAGKLPDLVRYLNANPYINIVNFQAVVPTLFKPWDATFFHSSPYWPNKEDQLAKLLQSLDELEALRDQGAKVKNPPSQFAHWRRYFSDPQNFLSDEVCQVDQSSLQVASDGRIALCNQHGALGTVDDDPRELWESDKAVAVREQMRRCRCPCIYFVNCCYVET